MDTIRGYVAIGAAIGGAYVYYNWDKLKLKQAVTPVSDLAREVAPTKPSTKKKKAAKPTPAQPKAATPAAPTPATVDDDDDDDNGGAAVQDNDKDWARQLQARKTGVSITGPAAAKAAPSKKQNKSKKQDTNGTSTSTASELDAASSGTAGLAKAPVAGGVSDMLDAPAPAASVLRITGEEKAKKQQPAKEVQAQETKKQRQNRRKVEEQKIQRDADEKQRQVLLENQRRTAREARGEPAKNGMTSAAVPSSSVWTAASSQDTSASTENTSQTAPLLDTFEQEAAPTPATTKPASKKSITDDIPSEESQMQMLNEIDGNSGWNEVSKGKKVKGKATNGQLVGDQASNASSSIDLTNGITSAVQAAVLPSKKGQPTSNGGAAPKKTSYTNGFAALQAATSYNTSRGHPDDSDWAVV